MWALNTLNSTINWAVGTTSDHPPPDEQKFPIDLDNSFTSDIIPPITETQTLLDIDLTSPMKIKNNNGNSSSSPVEFKNDILLTDSTNIILNNNKTKISAISPIVPNNIAEPDLNDLDKSVIDRSMTDIDTLNLSLGGLKTEDELIKEVSIMRAETAQLVKENKALENEVNKLKSKNDNLMKSLKNASNDSEITEKYKKEAQMRTDLENKVKELLKQLNFSTEEQNILVNEKKSIIEENNKVVDILKSEILEMKKEHTLNISKPHDNSEMDLLKLEFENCQKDVSEASDTILRLNSEFSILNNDYLSSQNDVYALSENLSSLQISSDAAEIEYKRQIDTLTVKLEVNDKILANLYTQLNESADLKSQIIRKDNEIENLTNLLENEQAKVRSKSEDVERTIFNMKSQLMELKLLREENNQLKLELNKDKNSDNYFKDKFAELELSFSNLTAELSKLKSENSKLITNISDKNKMKDLLDNQENLNRELSSTILNLESERIVQSNRISQLETNRLKLEAELANFKETEITPTDGISQFKSNQFSDFAPTICYSKIQEELSSIRNEMHKSILDIKDKFDIEKAELLSVNNELSRKNQYESSGNNHNQFEIANEFEDRIKCLLDKEAAYLENIRQLSFKLEEVNISYNRVSIVNVDLESKLAILNTAHLEVVSSWHESNLSLKILQKTYDELQSEFKIKTNSLSEEISSLLQSNSEIGGLSDNLQILKVENVNILKLISEKNEEIKNLLKVIDEYKLNNSKLEEIVKSFVADKNASIDSLNQTWLLKVANLEADTSNHVIKIEKLSSEISCLNAQMTENLSTIESLRSQNNISEASKEAYNQLSQQVVKLKEAYFMREDQFKNEKAELNGVIDLLNNKIKELEQCIKVDKETASQNVIMSRTNDLLLELQAAKLSLSRKETELDNELKLHLETKEQFKLEVNNKLVMLKDQKSKINELIDASQEMQTACLLHNEELANERSNAITLRLELENVVVHLREKEFELMECKASFLILKNDFDRVSSELSECSGALIALRNELKLLQTSSSPTSELANVSSPTIGAAEYNYSELKTAYDTLKAASGQLKAKAQSKISELKNMVVVLQAELDKLNNEKSSIAQELNFCRNENFTMAEKLLDYNKLFENNTILTEDKNKLELSLKSTLQEFTTQKNIIHTLEKESKIIGLERDQYKNSLDESLNTIKSLEFQSEESRIKIHEHRTKLLTLLKKTKLMESSRLKCFEIISSIKADFEHILSSSTNLNMTNLDMSIIDAMNTSWTQSIVVDSHIAQKWQENVDELLTELHTTYIPSQMPKVEEKKNSELSSKTANIASTPIKDSTKHDDVKDESPIEFSKTIDKGNYLTQKAPTTVKKTKSILKIKKKFEEKEVEEVYIPNPRNLENNEYERSESPTVTQEDDTAGKLLNTIYNFLDDKTS